MGSVPIVPPLSKVNIEQKAENFLCRYLPEIWTVRMPVPVDNIFENIIPDLTGIKVTYTNLSGFGITNAEGYTNARQKISMVDSALSDDFSITGRRRFRSTVGHEIGHCILHVGLDKWQQSLLINGQGMKRERSDLKAYQDPEWQAWKFCQALCMPEKLTRKIFMQYNESEDIVEFLSDWFDMSYSFVRTRLKALKLNPANSYSY